MALKSCRHNNATDSNTQLTEQEAGRDEPQSVHMSAYLLPINFPMCMLPVIFQHLSCASSRNCVCDVTWDESHAADVPAANGAVTETGKRSESLNENGVSHGDAACDTAMIESDAADEPVTEPCVKQNGWSKRVLRVWRMLVSQDFLREVRRAVVHQNSAKPGRDHLRQRHSRSAFPSISNQ